MKIPIHDPKEYKHAHIRSQAEELLNQIRQFDSTISRLVIVAQELNSGLSKK